MSLFTKSYLTTEQLELSRIAASSSPSGPPALQQPEAFTSSSLLRSTRNIPLELRAPPYNPLAEPKEIADNDPSKTGDNELDHTYQPAREEALTAGEPLGSMGTSSTMAASSQEKESKRARTSQIAKLLFPTCASTLGSKTTRSRNATSLGNQTDSFTLSTAPSSLSTESTPLFSELDGSALALPLARQLRSLKEENQTLLQASIVGDERLAEATLRIQQLEDNLAEVKLRSNVEAEGWEAEASRLAQELAHTQKQYSGQSNVEVLESKLSKVEQALAIETSKKRRAKEMIAKLKCEVINRRLKEKYEVELLEREERNFEIKLVEAEFHLAIVRSDLNCEKAEREGLEWKEIKALSLARQHLVSSLSTSEKTNSSLSASLSEAQTAISAREATMKELEETIVSLKEEVAKNATRDGAGESRIREKNERLGQEVKDLKAQLKTSQIALKSAQSTSATTTSALETTEQALSDLRAEYTTLASSTSSLTKKAGSAPKDSESIVNVAAHESADDDEESEIESEAEQVLTHVKKSDVQKPVKSTKPSAKAVKKSVKNVKEAVDDRPTATEGEDESDCRVAAVSPPPVAAKKRKAAVLSDKTVNLTQDKGTTATKVKKDKNGVGAKKKTLSLEFSEDERPTPAVKEREKEKKADPAKKKKRKLFGDAKKGFDWQTQIENADVNGLIPGNLSPIKLNRTSKPGLLSALGGGIKKSIF